MYYIYRKTTVPSTRETKYPSGEKIPESLPDSYGPAQMCSTCAAFDSASSMCAVYKAAVMPNYWCASWTKKQ